MIAMFKVYKFYVNSFSYARAIVRDLLSRGVTCGLNAEARNANFVSLIVIHNGDFEFPPAAVHCSVNFIEHEPEILSIETA